MKRLGGLVLAAAILGVIFGLAKIGRDQKSEKEQVDELVQRATPKANAEDERIRQQQLREPIKPTRPFAKITVKEGTAKGSTEKTPAIDAVETLVDKCFSRSAGGYRDAWLTVGNAEVSKDSISTRGKTIDAWNIAIHFTAFDDVLWYQVRVSDGATSPTKDEASSMCGGIPRDQFTVL